MSAWGNSWGLAWGNAWGRTLEHHRACPERTYMIPADDRLYTVQDDRRFVVPPDDRRYTVKGC